MIDSEIVEGLFLDDIIRTNELIFAVFILETRSEERNSSISDGELPWISIGRLMIYLHCRRSTEDAMWSMRRWSEQLWSQQNDRPRLPRVDSLSRHRRCEQSDLDYSKQEMSHPSPSTVRNRRWALHCRVLRPMPLVWRFEDREYECCHSDHRWPRRDRQDSSSYIDHRSSARILLGLDRWRVSSNIFVETRRTLRRLTVA